MSFETEIELTTLDELEATFINPLPDSGAFTQSQHEAEFDSCYEMILQVGAGAMGQVFLAQDTDLLRKVAYKRLHSQLGISQEVLARFVREVQITAQLEHPNVVPVYKLEKTAQGWAYSMKLVFGKTFKELITAARAACDQNLPPDEALSLRSLLEHFLKVCEAMDYAHQRGVIHRDLKPANIMVGRYGEVYVMDWGIARLMGAHRQTEASDFIALESIDENNQTAFEETRAGQILGTPRYLSPEQATGRNDELDGRSDLLTLGLILYELVSLQPAYKAKNMTELLKKVLKTEKEPLLAYHRSRPVPRELKAIIDKATARKPEDRYQRVSEMADDIRRYLAGDAVLAQPDTSLQAAVRWLGKHQFLSAGLIGGALMILLLAALGSLWTQHQASLRLQLQTQSLSNLQTQTSMQAQTINNRLLGVSVLLQGLSSAAGSALDGLAVAGPRYFEAQFIQPGQAPKDFQQALRYSKLISLDYPVFGPPGAPESPQLNGLSKPLQQIFERAAGNEPHYRQRVYERGLPIAWAMVALHSGSWMAYPGQAGYPLGFDPRQQDWYQSGLRAARPVWVRPHADTQGQGLLLPVVQSIRRGQGQLAGVAMLEMSFQYLVDDLMNLEIPGLLQSYLFDKQGHIMVRSSERNRMLGMRFGAFNQHQAIDTPLFDQHIAVEAIQHRRSGILRYYRDGRPVILAYYPLKALGWYYAIEVDQESLFGNGE